MAVRRESAVAKLRFDPLDPALLQTDILMIRRGLHSRDIAPGMGIRKRYALLMGAHRLA